MSYQLIFLNFKRRWTTYLKSRLNCSIPGDYPFYFNHLRKFQDTFRNPKTLCGLSFYYFQTRSSCSSTRKPYLVYFYYILASTTYRIGELHRGGKLPRQDDEADLRSFYYSRECHRGKRYLCLSGPQILPFHHH